MNNKYYKVVYLLKQYLDNIPTLNTKLFSRSQEKDLFKNTVFPLAHISNESIDFQSINVNTFSFEVAVLDKRIIDNEKSDDKFTGDANIIDNYATTYAIINDFLTQLYAGDHDVNYDIESVSSITPIYLDDTNGLDGWAVSITLSVSNDLNLCE